VISLGLIRVAVRLFSRWDTYGMEPRWCLLFAAIDLLLSAVLRGRFDADQIGHPRTSYVATAPDLQQPVTALSLGGLRRRIEALLVPDDIHIVLHLDRAARLERDQRRRRGGEGRMGDYGR
jgi:hypothetical protein